jgi:hypothetical protein
MHTPEISCQRSEFPPPTGGDRNTEPYPTLTAQELQAILADLKALKEQGIPAESPPSL